MIVRYHGLSASPPAALRAIRGVLFDMDDTLVTSTLDFALMRSRLGILPTQDIIKTMRSWTGAKREEAEQIVRELEDAAKASAAPHAGAHDVLAFLASRKIPTAIITRNNADPLNHVIAAHFAAHPFSPLLHRDSCAPKPHPEGFLLAASEWGVDPRDCMIVGDHGDDLRCGKDGGGVSVLVRRGHNEKFEKDADIVVNSLDEIVELIENGFDVERESTSEA